MTTEKVPTSCRRQFHVRAKENPNDVVKEHSRDLYGAILKKKEVWNLGGFELLDEFVLEKAIKPLF